MIISMNFIQTFIAKQPFLHEKIHIKVNQTHVDRKESESCTSCFSFHLRRIILVNFFSISHVRVLPHFIRESKCFCNLTRDVTPQAFIYFRIMFRLQKTFNLI